MKNPLSKKLPKIKTYNEGRKFTVVSDDLGKAKVKALAKKKVMKII